MIDFFDETVDLPRDFFSIITNITRAHCEAMGYTKPAAAQETKSPVEAESPPPAPSAGPEVGSPLWNRLRDRTEFEDEELRADWEAHHRRNNGGLI